MQCSWSRAVKWLHIAPQCFESLYNFVLLSAHSCPGANEDSGLQVGSACMNITRQLCSFQNKLICIPIAWIFREKLQFTLDKAQIPVLTWSTSWAFIWGPLRLPIPSFFNTLQLITKNTISFSFYRTSPLLLNHEAQQVKNHVILTNKVDLVYCWTNSWSSINVYCLNKSVKVMPDG